MDKLKSISLTKKAIIATSGIAAISIGAYFLYRRLRRGENDLAEKRPKKQIVTDHQPSENFDEYEAASGKKVLVLGLEKSGKSCLLAAMLNEQAQKEYQPTLGFNVICITNINKRLDIMEIGGSARYKEYWDRFVNGTDLLVYVIDSSNTSSLSDTLVALEDTLKLEALLDIPVIIVFSKRDKDTSVPISDLISQIKQKEFENERFQYATVQVQCGGAPSTEGVENLQEQMTQLC
ncbi:ADP-ribosylation factor-like protein 3 [Rhopilema esculentum]|uniref:ADP-ribosylation factor-like protein 3 n=1 Tax=Rhopilema esculentum TaxID=499914 RepID=UPI0031DCB636